MTIWLRRLFWLGVLCGAGFAVWNALQRRKHATTTPSPAPAPAPAATTVAPTTFAPVADPQPLWVTPVDGVCPDGYTIKVGAKSEVYHVPGGRFYERTVAERCYASADDAEADGYRRAKT
jgi:hypothetical protein